MARYRGNITINFIFLIFQHTDDKKYMTWNVNFINEIEDVLDHLEEKGRNLAVIIDPHIKTDTNYFLYSDAVNKGK